MPVLLADLLSGKATKIQTVKGRVVNPDGSVSKRGLLGCEGCPLNKSPFKFLSTKNLADKKVVLWSLAPAAREIEQEKMYASDSWRWLWKQFEKVGLAKEDFAKQYVVRCHPVEKRDGKLFNRLPSKVELRQCSHHTNRMLNELGDSPRVWVVVGVETAEQLLRGEFKKSKPVFWSEKYGVHVIYIDHPLTLMQGKADWKLEKFRARLKALPFLIENRGRWAYLNKADYGGLFKPKEVAHWLDIMRAKAKKGVRISVDIEDAKINGTRRLLCVGFAASTTKARAVVLYHPENKYPQYIERNLALVKEFLEDPSIQKVLHYGSSDKRGLRKTAGIKLRGYEYDTTYAHYLRYTFLRSHGLEAIADEHYPLFAGYKQYVAQYTAGGDFSKIPLQKIIRYNCQDTCLTKQIEKDTEPHISLPLLKVYTWAGMTISSMERRGPAFDERYAKEVVSIVPKRIEKLITELKLLSGDPEFNPGANLEVAAILYDKLGMPCVNDKPGKERATDKQTLDLLSQEAEHPFLDALKEWRSYEKMEGTYIKKYAESARLNNGELRAKWYLTGAVTGRLRCGGKGDGFEGVINFQNLHGKPFLQNMLVSDPKWRDILIGTDEYTVSTSFAEDNGDLWVFLSADYSQVEIRMLAEVSGDKLLLKQFQDAALAEDPSDPRADIHCLVGNLLNPAWSLEFIKGDKPTRTFIKNCHFGMVYGLSEEGLYHYLVAKGVKTSLKKVRKFHRAYFAKYKGVARFIEVMREKAEREGHVDTIFGFVRRVGAGDYDTSRSTNPMNQAINSPIQGAAHQLLLNIMAILNRKPAQYHLLANLLAEVHDALVYRVRLRDLPAAYNQCKELMEKQVADFTHKIFGRALRVPLLSECSAGFRYGVQVEYHGAPASEFLKAWNKKNAKVEAEVAAEFLTERKAR